MLDCELLPPELTAGSDRALDLLFADHLVHYGRGWRPFSDAPWCLRAVRAAAGRSPSSPTGPADQQSRTVLATGLAGEVDGVFTSEGVGAAKPHRAAFDAVAAAMTVEPARALDVGDSFPVDYRGAVDAGWQALLLDRAGYGPSGVPSLASLDELPTHPTLSR